MSQRRESWKPGQGSGKQGGAGTMMVPADGVKRVERRSTPAPRHEESRDDSAVPVAGSGRGLPIAAGPAPEADDGPAAPRPGGPSPFSGYAPTADELARHAAAGAESSNQVAAIVLGMGFVLSMITILVLVILAVGLFAWRQKQDADGLADAEKDKSHIRDTAVADEIIKRRTGNAGGGGAAADPDAPPEDDAGGEITTGPVTVIVPEHVFFHSLEINCPDAGIRRRAKFRGRKASTSGVPIREDCIITFQGSQPAKATIRGGQTIDCVSVNPTECRVL